MTVDPASSAELIDDVVRGARRATRAPSHRRSTSSRAWRGATSPSDNIMVPTIALANAGGTTGEWADALREVFGEYRAPTGVRRGRRRTR